LNQPKEVCDHEVRQGKARSTVGTVNCIVQYTLVLYLRKSTCKIIKLDFKKKKKKDKTDIKGKKWNRRMKERQKEQNANLL
jgi:hypothetical protein